MFIKGLSDSLDFLFAGQYVGMDVEISEHHHKRRGNKHSRVYHRTGGFAVGLHQGVAEVREHQYELEQLDNGYVLLPPTRLHIPADGGEVVVGVHEHVHGHVQEAEREQGAAIAAVRNVYVSAEGHDQMVKDVQEGHLTILLSQHKKDRLQQIHEFVEEVRVGYPSLPVFVLVIQRQSGDAT
ncbi:hypothetical protein M5D96_000243 [Drosophila gunungcola]|uniref:Uncharacterized protein n=1 Tax=Drosophila gunungcola TaxID=103775 RepID=A0A9P9YWJ6_9MUSC|nr:hypothetical protein M5D96_000243 [Drosophila gunungcola]